MFRGPFFDWLSRSLVGHIVFLEIFASIPAFLGFVIINFWDATLAWTLQVAFLSCIAGVVAALAIWYTVTLPMIKRLKPLPTRLDASDEKQSGEAARRR
jgi:hypothetical protein